MTNNYKYNHKIIFHYTITDILLNLLKIIKSMTSNCSSTNHPFFIYFNKSIIFHLIIINGPINTMDFKQITKITLLLLLPF